MGVLLLTGALATAADAPRAEAASTLTLSPSSGPPGTMVTATFVYDPVGPECLPEPVEFTWAGAPWAMGAMDGSCVVVVSAPALAGDPGLKQVRARMGGSLKANKQFDLQAPPATTTTTSPPLATPTTKPTLNTVAVQVSTATTVAGSTTSVAASTTTTEAIAGGDEVAVAVPDDTTAPFNSDDDADDTSSNGSGGTEVRAKGVSVFVGSTPGPQQVSLKLAVVGTNVILTMLLLLVFGGTSAVFNSTLDSNREVIEGWLAKLRGKFKVFGNRLRMGTAMSPAVRVMVVVALAGTVYGFLSPGFTFDRAGLFLFLSLSLGITVVTYVSEGGAIWFSRHRLKTQAAIRVHTGALLTALACVVVSRLLDFQPGLLYGFVASTAFLGAKLDRRQNGKAAFYPALMLLGTSVAAWLTLGWVRSGSDNGWLHQLVEAILAVLFVGGIEGVLFNMLPIAFLDGRSIIEWNRVAWLGLFGVTMFLFWQLLINPHDSYFDAVRETGVALVLSAALIYMIVTAGTWFYFRRLAARAERVSV